MRDVASKIIALVAEQTGYPEDMLDLDLDMEADLGIDTVKQAETFAAIQEEFDIPASDDLTLRDYNTLEKVIGFVQRNAPRSGAGCSRGAGSRQSRLPHRRQRRKKRKRAQTAVGDPIAAKIIALVAEQTGYPEDMLDLDLDMEADLGIDTVKQAETFAAIQEEYNIPTREDLSLREYNTLEKVIGFVKEMRPDLAEAAPAASVPAAPVTAMVETAPEVGSDGDDPIAAKIIALVAEQTGYPEDMLDLDLDLEADLGIDTVKQAETFAAIQEEYDIPTRRRSLSCANTTRWKR